MKKGEINEANGISLIGKMLNCMFNNSKSTPTQHNIAQMKSEWKNGNSPVIRMIGTKIDQMDAVFRYWIQHNPKTNSSEQSYSSSDSQDQNSSSENFPEWGNTYNGVAEHWLLNAYEKNARWYAIAYHNLYISSKIRTK